MKIWNLNNNKIQREGYRTVSFGQVDDAPSGGVKIILQNLNEKINEFQFKVNYSVWYFN
jgi:hypothetical protein